MLLVHLFVCFVRVSFRDFSLPLGLAAVCDCGTPWTFLLTFLHDPVRTCDIVAAFSKDYFAVDVEMSKCLHATSSNALFRTTLVARIIAV